MSEFVKEGVAIISDPAKQGLLYRPRADLARVEDQRQRIGQQPDDSQHAPSGALVDGGMPEVAVGGNDLKHLPGNGAPNAAPGAIAKLALFSA